MNWLPPYDAGAARLELKEIQVTVCRATTRPDSPTRFAPRPASTWPFLRVEPGYDLEYHVGGSGAAHRPSFRATIASPRAHPSAHRNLVGESFIAARTRQPLLRAVTEDYLRRSGLDIKVDHGVTTWAMALCPSSHPPAGWR